jgi:hypothetical protein
MAVDQNVEFEMDLVSRDRCTAELKLHIDVLMA